MIYNVAFSYHIRKLQLRLLILISNEDVQEQLKRKWGSNILEQVHEHTELEGVKIENKLTGPGIKSKICKKCLPSDQKNCGSSWTFQIPISSFKLELKKQIWSQKLRNRCTWVSIESSWTFISKQTTHFSRLH